MTKIAIPTKNDRINSHFGQAEQFSIYKVDESGISLSEVVDASEGCGCRSNIISILKGKGVQVMLAGSMGEGAYYRLIDQGIEVIRGCRGQAETFVRSYASGELADDGSTCGSHAHHHHH